MPTRWETPTTANAVRSSRCRDRKNAGTRSIPRRDEDPRVVDRERRRRIEPYVVRDGRHRPRPWTRREEGGPLGVEPVDDSLVHCDRGIAHVPRDDLDLAARLL